MNAAFAKATAERAVKTFLQVYFALFLVGDVALNAFEMDWLGPQLGVAVGATVLSVVTSLLSQLGGPDNGPSLAGEQLETHATTPRDNVL